MLATLLLESDSDVSAVVGFSVMALVGVVILVITILVKQANKAARLRIEAWMASHSFLPSATLPETLVAPESAWKAPPRTSRIFVGRHNDYDVAFFEITIVEGESQSSRTAVAVRRSPATLPEGHLKNATLDKTSTPGWVIASAPGASAEPPTLTVMLNFLTGPTPFDQ